MEAKAIEFKMEGELVKIVVDPNKDGAPLLEIAIHMSQLPAEFLSIIKK